MGTVAPRMPTSGPPSGSTARLRFSPAAGSVVVPFEGLDDLLKSLVAGFLLSLPPDRKLPLPPRPLPLPALAELREAIIITRRAAF